MVSYYISLINKLHYLLQRLAVSVRLVIIDIILAFSQDNLHGLFISVFLWPCRSCGLFIVGHLLSYRRVRRYAYAVFAF